MPRQIDLFSQNLQITNDPNNQISVTAAQINNLKDQIPAAIANAEQLFINTVLDAIDKATGLDLVDWLADTQAFFNSISAALQQSWLTLQNFFNGLAQETDADVTAALQWLQGQFNQLQALLQQSWLNFQNLLNGIVQEADADVAAAIAYLNGIGTAANQAWTFLEDYVATGDASDLTAALQGIYQAVFGSSTGLGLVGQIPAPAVVNVTQNLQPVWDFPDSASVSAGGQWSWDGTQDHTGVTGSGSAKVVANGTVQALRGIPGAVQPAQVVTPSAWVMWSGLTAAGGTSPIQLELIPYSGAGSSLVAGTPVTIASVTSPGSSHAWEELTGTYTVPSSGVTAVQLRLVVTADATAGTVNWDDCTADLSGGFLADLQADTNDVVNSLAPGGTAAEFVTGIQNLLALFGLSKSTLGSATDLTAFWTAIVNDFINPLNALEISAVNGLATALSALLGTTTFQTLLDSVANALGHSGTGHTITNIETYLGLIPPANVTNVLGGANLGADVSSVHSTASNASSWSTRLTNDLLITSDVFHLTYQAGSTGDAPGTLGTNGKPTWYSAWNDLLALAGVVNSVTAPTDPAPTVASAVMTAQDTADGASDDAGSALDQLTAVPQQNVVPLEVATGQPAALVASGAGDTNTGLGSVTLSWTDTIPSTANYVLVVANTATTHGATSASVRVTVGGVSKLLPLVGVVPYSSSGKLILFGVANPPTGSATFNVTVIDSTSLFSLASATSMSLSNAVSLSVMASSNAVGASPSLSTSFTSSQLVINAIGTLGTGGAAVGLSSYNRTSRYHAGNFNGGSQFNMDLIAGTVSGVSSPSFTASVANTTNEGYAALAVAVNPPPNILGSYARAFRASTSGVGVGVATALAGHYGNVFDTSAESADMTVDLTTGRITVSYSGTYLFKAGIAFTGLFTTQTMEGECLVNGALFERSAQAYYGSSNQTGFAWSTPVFLNAGDYVEPGCLFGTTATISVVGDSTGTKTYMTLTLLNRGLTS